QAMGVTYTVISFQYDLIVFVSKGDPNIKGKRLPDICSFHKVVGRNHVHQNQKPIERLERYVKKHSNEGDVVFDGFMGSGTTAIAALDMDRKYIGFELDKHYYDVAINRIKNHTTQTELFDYI